MSTKKLFLQRLSVKSLSIISISSIVVFPDLFGSNISYELDKYSSNGTGSIIQIQQQELRIEDQITVSAADVDESNADLYAKLAKVHKRKAEMWKNPAIREKHERRLRERGTTADSVVADSTSKAEEYQWKILLLEQRKHQYSGD